MELLQGLIMKNKITISPQELYNTLVTLQIELEENQIDIPELHMRINDLKKVLFDNFSCDCCKIGECKDK